MTPEQRAILVGSRLGTKQQARASVDVDLAVNSLLNAMGLIGEGPYVLTVHPYMLGWAKSKVVAAFGGYAPFVEEVAIVAGDFKDMDEWALENATVRYYSPGA